MDRKISALRQKILPAETTTTGERRDDKKAEIRQDFI